MEEILIQNAQTFASQHQLQLAERLGFGIHGIIFVAEGKSTAGKTALKVHRSVEPYLREREVYERLRDGGVSEILGFNVPQLIRFDDGLRIIEMSIVARPFVLDFAGAWLDTPPDFPDETWPNGKRRSESSSALTGQGSKPCWKRWRRWTFTWWMYLPATSRSSTERMALIPGRPLDRPRQ